MSHDLGRLVRCTAQQRVATMLSSLAGILEGMVLDRQITDDELQFLNGWLDQHTALLCRHPANEIIPLLAPVFRGGTLTEDAREDILWLCRKLTSDAGYFDQVTRDLQRLHGLMGGIIADGRITTDELTCLQDWLLEHEHLRSCWPYDELDAIVIDVMVDQQIDDDEHRKLMAFFADFIAIDDGAVLTTPPVKAGETIIGLCAACPTIEFADKTFCFTGESGLHTRAELEALVTQRGGTILPGVSKKLDYLVIGAGGNPCWTYACYGRKVEQAVKLRKAGCRLMLVHERDFHDAVADLEV